MPNGVNRPIFPGVGTRSRIADVQAQQSQLGLQQEALNRQSGQQLLELLTGTGLQTGDLINQIIQAQLGREQELEAQARAQEFAAEESQAERAARRRLEKLRTAGDIELERERGAQARLTQAEEKELADVSIEDRFDTKLAALTATTAAEALELAQIQNDTSPENVTRITNQLNEAKARSLTLQNPEEASFSEVGRIILQQLQVEGLGSFQDIGPPQPPSPGFPGVPPFGLQAPRAALEPVTPSVETAPLEDLPLRAAKRRLRERSQMRFREEEIDRLLRRAQQGLQLLPPEAFPRF